MKRMTALPILTALALTTVSAWPSAAADPVNLTVYTSIDKEQLQPLKDAFEAANPGITISWFQDSAGIITARYLAEKENPVADAIYGLPVSSLVTFKKQGLLEAYTPAHARDLKPRFQDADEPASWTGMEVFTVAICVNTEILSNEGLPPVKTWRDLLNPAFEKRVTMPNPASSSTGFAAAWGWVQSMGEEKAWNYMADLDKNIAEYGHSGSAPCVQAGRGEYAIGISYDMRGAREKTLGAPLDIVIPEEGIGWDMDGAAIPQGTKHLEAAQKLMDFAASTQANKLYSKWLGIVADPAVTPVIPNYPEHVEERLVTQDFGVMAEARDQFLVKWNEKFGNR